ncbi:uncharacterized protein LOC121735181 isoform X2 [Aricia agestis]|uniref:uncharacterized protein LOC121735181 isoform X2 n=1 Tax=Aricia agestis TaxID=91739 RepID=UPI001C204786|nr:uncharacterized protein LOC121735181 isoform X2 [Aricia agestis]
MKFTIVILCFIFGIFENVYSDPDADRPKGLEVADSKADSGLDERAGLGQRPGKSLVRPNPLNMVVCYACTNCDEVNKDTSDKLCPYTPDTRKQGKCVKYVERFGPPHQLITVRGCMSDRGTCEEIKKAHENSGKYVQLVSCNECDGDKCNGAPKSMVDLTVAFITVAVLPLLGKCTLS